MFRRLLIANRGEIACRVARTCRRLGIASVAVHSDADAGARHVREADVAVRIGPPPAAQSYLDADAIVRAAVASGAEAVHPGYGFLSERLSLLDACRDAGIVFVGPHRDAIAAMGSKIESKRIAREAGVPCVPGYDGDDQRPERLAREAGAIGFPLLVKASAGGGGKGMRRVDRAEDFLEQLDLARREARAAFGDDRVLLERYIERPRHVEVQLLGDRHGGLVHLFERECSIQRHYQKLVEEAPAAHLQDGVRDRLYDAALALGRRIGYDSAGTVEFVLDADRENEPYFLEMNTRLQVEHPVTEMTVGLDLVEWQIRVAAGEPLGLDQARVRREGWAIEARVNAESPEDGFAPSIGTVSAYEEPALPGVRVDSGIDAGSEVGPHYDSLVAKVVAWGGTRAVARDRLRGGLQALRIEGLRTTQPMLVDVLGHSAFDEVLTTGFIARHWPGGWRRPSAQRDEVHALAAAARVLPEPHDGDRPLDTLVGWRLTAPAGRFGSCHVQVVEDGAGPEARVDYHGARVAEVHLDGRAVRVERLDGDGWRVAASGRRYRVRRRGDRVELWHAGDARLCTVTPIVRLADRGAAAAADDDLICSDMPGVLATLLVEPGDAVDTQTPVAVIESMKLLHTLVAPRRGTVAALPIAAGTTVLKGDVVAVLETLAADRAA